MQGEQRTSRYRNFSVSMYARVYEVLLMTDERLLDEYFGIIDRALQPDKVYLETHRDMQVIPEDDLRRITGYFHDRGIRTAGGITITVDEGKLFQTYCYTNPDHRARLKGVVELTARNFDEIILDDFFFTNCKCENCIRARGDRDWAEFRLALLDQAAQELIIGPARKVNPNVELVVKFPNWYEHYQHCGMDLEGHAKNFDRIYTGTETRDPAATIQHLQEYLGYSIIRYLNNVKPGGNGGGWVDPAAMGTLDRYAEQVWLTLFAKTPEITMFDFRQLLYPVTRRLRGRWQNSRTSFSYRKTLKAAKRGAGRDLKPVVAWAAGEALRIADETVGRLGNPVGIAAYRPFHSHGEDYLHNYIGMIGIPVEMTPCYPSDASVILLARSAGKDSDLVGKIDTSLREGHTVIITSGLLHTLNGRGFNRIAELEMTGNKALVHSFISGFSQKSALDFPVLFSHMRYNTNDSWEIVSGAGPYTGYPVLVHSEYGQGNLYVLNMPDNWSDLYRLPVPVLDTVRERLCRGLPVYTGGEARVALFLYDNNTFIVESFRDSAVHMSVYLGPACRMITDMNTGRVIHGKRQEQNVVWRNVMTEERTCFDIPLKAHSFRVFTID